MATRPAGRAREEQAPGARAPGPASPRACEARRPWLRPRAGRPFARGPGGARNFAYTQIDARGGERFARVARHSPTELASRAVRRWGIVKAGTGRIAPTGARLAN